VRFSLASAALLGVVLGPLRQNWRSTPRDGFPLSYYPMFSARRWRTGTVTHLVGVDAGGGTRLLHYRHAGTGGLNQVRRQIRRCVAGDRAHALAESVAGSIARSRSAADSGITQVRVVSARYDYDAYFAGNRVPERETVHASAPVDRSPR